MVRGLSIIKKKKVSLKTTRDKHFGGEEQLYLAHINLSIYYIIYNIPLSKLIAVPTDNQKTIVDRRK